MLRNSLDGKFLKMIMSILIFIGVILLCRMKN